MWANLMFKIVMIYKCMECGELLTAKKIEEIRLSKINPKEPLSVDVIAISLCENCKD